MEAKDIIKAVSSVITVIVLVVVGALFVGTLLAQSVFSSLTIINTTAIANSFGLFVTGLIAFLSLIGTIVGLVWLVGYFKPLFSKKDGIQSFDGN